MSGLIGPVGGLESVWFTNSEPESVDSRHTYTKALSGRVTAQRSPRPRRSWSCGMDESLPEDYHVVEQLASWPSPLVWYSAAACRSNVLTPKASLFEGGTWTGGATGGAGDSSDDTRYYYSRVAGIAETMRLVDLVPVPNEGPISVGVYISTHPASPAMLYVDEVDPEGRISTTGAIEPSRALVGTHSASVAANQHAQRAVVQFTPSVRTVALNIRVVGALMISAPSVTFTASALPWATGRGCLTSVIDLGGEQHHFGQVASDGFMRVTSRSFTITELG